MANILALLRPLPTRWVLLAYGLGCLLLPTAKADAAPNADDPKLAARFAGRVVDSDGKPVGNARIYLSPTESGPMGEKALRAKTDAEGRFAFEAPDLTFLDTDGLPSRKEGLLVAMAEG